MLAAHRPKWRTARKGDNVSDRLHTVATPDPGWVRQAAADIEAGWHGSLGWTAFVDVPAVFDECCAAYAMLAEDHIEVAMLEHELA